MPDLTVYSTTFLYSPAVRVHAFKKMKAHSSSAPSPSHISRPSGSFGDGFVDSTPVSFFLECHLTGAMPYRVQSECVENWH